MVSKAKITNFLKEGTLKLAIAITGSSGTNLATKLINNIPSDTALHIVISKSALYSSTLENKSFDFTHKNYTLYDDSDIGAALASGSFKIDKFAIIPCSMNTLAKCAVGISDTLITRAFSVNLKERRDILLAPREMPFSAISLENMLKLSKLGVMIAPPVLGYYAKEQTIDDMENFIVGKWLDLLKIEHQLFKRWGEN